MGYYTTREMTVSNVYSHQPADKETVEQIKREITRIHLAYQDYTEADIDSMLSSNDWQYECPMGDTTKWYECDTDMRAVSLLFPDYYILVDSTGEEGDRWADYYWKGRMQRDVLIMQYNPINFNEMMEEKI